MGKIWELDFYSRPILDENKKKLWEVLICESPRAIDTDTLSLFKYAQFCPPTTVNSIWLREAIEKAMAAAGETPQKIRFFRRQMNNMIAKACDDAGIPPSPSRRTYALNQWLQERMADFYPHQPGYDGGATQSASVQYPLTNPIALPDAVRGDRQDKWALVSLEASAFREMKEWEIGFGEAFPLSMVNITPETKIPGLIMFSPRSVPLAAWMSGLELCYLHLEKGDLPKLCLETGVSESWILANITDEQTLAEAQGFEVAKQQANGVHFLAIQSAPEAQSFAGFWLLNSPQASTSSLASPC
jgi:hypothetical protein